MAPVSWRRRKSSSSARRMRHPMRAPNLLAFELAAVDPAAHGLLMGADVAGDVGDGQQFVGAVGAGQ
jgi:hypothetical protein